MKKTEHFVVQRYHRNSILMDQGIWTDLINYGTGLTIKQYNVTLFLDFKIISIKDLMQKSI